MRCMFCEKPVGEDDADGFMTDANEGVACVPCGEVEVVTQAMEAEDDRN